MTTLDRISAVMGCTPEDDEDLVEAVRLLVSERDEARADRARLLAYTDECGVLAVRLVERVHQALETHQGVVRERDAARALADGLRVELAAALTAVAAECARREAAEAECTRLRVDLAAVRRAVRMLDGARAAIDANGQRVLRSLAGEERAALVEELAAARRERDDWNARATALEAERDAARAALDAALGAT